MSNLNDKRQTALCRILFFMSGENLSKDNSKMRELGFKDSGINYITYAVHLKILQALFCFPLPDYPP